MNLNIHMGYLDLGHKMILNPNNLFDIILTISKLL